MSGGTKWYDRMGRDVSDMNSDLSCITECRVQKSSKWLQQTSSYCSTLWICRSTRIVLNLKEFRIRSNYTVYKRRLNSGKNISPNMATILTNTTASRYNRTVIVCLLYEYLLTFQRVYTDLWNCSPAQTILFKHREYFNFTSNTCAKHTSTVSLLF